ncbi:MAG TPA: NADH-quinone oxidoreductase subunit L [Planctomycetota bacterium]|nr:NADH-quinone oxidoreductase subunit L [Planctomycetota bacterium]
MIAALTFTERIADFLYNALPVHDRGLFQQTLFLIPLFPFIGFLLNGLFGSRMDKKAAGWIGSLAALASFIWAFFSVIALQGSGSQDPDVRNALHAVYGNWLSNGDVNFAFGLYLDSLSSVMILVVTGIGTLIHIYSMGYMSHDPGIARFFAYLNLFLFAMILLVLGDNLIMLFVGWEGVGLCSYLLIGFWYEDGKNAAAGMKAFIVNRIGDLGFMLGIFMLFALFGTVNFVARPSERGGNKITKQTALTTSPTNKESKNYVLVPKHAGLLDYTEGLRLLAETNKDAKDDKKKVGYTADKAVSNFDLSKTTAAKSWAGWFLIDAITITCLLLFVGATGKSAQIPLYVWLPDAMAGPTPVSALIHAATMVTSGIYMICRLHSIFALSEHALLVIAVVGASTALFSALIGLTQLDIKKVLAYSTVSQLGYMFVGLGVGAFSLGIFHVLTHAFFKALLFLGAGSVIHAMSGEQDMRYMGGLRKKLPITFATMMVGSLALAGFPLLAGWYSKDAILMQVLAKHHESHQTIWLVVYAMVVLGAFCTAFYTFRLMGLTFFGENRASEDVKSHIHESPPSMTIPLVVLAGLSLFGGAMFAGAFVEQPQLALGIRNAFFSDDHHVHTINLAITFVVAVIGIGLGLALYAKGTRIPDPEKAKTNFLYRLSLNKFYVDETYGVLVAIFTIGSEIVHWLIETLFIDVAVVLGAGYGTASLSRVLRRIQSGLLNWYAGGILVGTLLVLFYLLP